MIDLSRWLPGLPPDPEEDDPVSRTLDLLGQGLASAQDAARSAGQAVGSYLPSLGAPAVPEATSAPYGPVAAPPVRDDWAQPIPAYVPTADEESQTRTRAIGQAVSGLVAPRAGPSPWEPGQYVEPEAVRQARGQEVLAAPASAASAALEAGRGAAEQLADPTDPRNAVLAGAPTVAPILGASAVVESALPAFGGEIGARLARGLAGPDAAPYVTVPEGVPVIGGQAIGPEEVGRYIGGGLTDPITYLGVPAAARAGHLGRGLLEASPIVGDAIGVGQLGAGLVRGGVGLARRGLGAAAETALGALAPHPAGIVPPHVADALGQFPIRIPDDPAVIRAIEAAGGRVDETGTWLHVIRNEDAEGIGGTAVRGMPFYIAGPPGTPNPYARTSGGHGTGGRVRTEGWTKFRNPLIIPAAPGEAAGFNAAMAQLGVRGSAPDAVIRELEHELATAENLVRSNPRAYSQTLIDNARDALEEARGGGAVVTDMAINDALERIYRSTQQGSQERFDAVRELVSRYGGDPATVEEMLTVRGPNREEAYYGIRENILAGNARNAGHDGVITVKPRAPLPDEISAHPAVKAVEAERFELNRRLGQIPREVDARAATLGAPAADAERLDDPQIKALIDEYNRLYERRQQIPQAMEDARTEAYRELSTGRITELADPREARNPTPAAPDTLMTTARADLQRELEDAEAEWQAWQAQAYAPGHTITPEERQASLGIIKRVNDAKTGLEILSTAVSRNPPGYALREDIALPEGVRRSTIVENPRARTDQAAVERASTELNALSDQWLAQVNRIGGLRPDDTLETWLARQSPEVQQEAARVQLRADELRAQMDAARAQPGAPRYVTAPDADAASPPPTQPSDFQLPPKLSAVERTGYGALSPSFRASADIGSAVGGAISGSQYGASLPADSEEERLRNRILGGIGGAISGPASLRVLGRGIGGASRAQRAAQSANPHVRALARQMQGRYNPSGVEARPLAERIAAALTDRTAIVGNVEREIGERIAASGGQAPVTRLAERIRENPNSIAAQRAREELAPAIQKVGDDSDWLEQVLVHRHNLDVARAKGQEAYDAAITAGRTPQQAQAIADRVRQSRLFSGGLTEADTVQALVDIQSEIGPQRFRTVLDAAQAFWDTGRRSLDEKLAEGMISPELHQALTTRYPHYVRTDIADYFEGGPSLPSPGGRQMGVSNVGIKPIDRVGTTKDRVNPVLSTIDALYAHEAASTRNAAGRDLAALRDADPTARGLFKEVAPDVKTYGANRGEMVPPDYHLRGNEQKLTVWENGEARQFVIPAEYAQLLNPKQGAFLGDSSLAQGARNFFGLWKSLITTHNPAFQMVVSPLRDAGDYAVGEATRSATRGGLAGVAQAAGALPGVVGDYLRALPAAFEGLGQGRFSQEVADLRRAGAGFEGRPQRTDAGLRAVYRDLQSSGGMVIRGPSDVARAARTLLTLGAEPIGSRLEMVPRIAAARRAAGRGADELGQAIASKDATIDFLRGGWFTQQLNVVVPFINPTVQSAAQVARLARKNPTAFAAALTAGVGVPAMLADAWNRSDPQRASDYEDVPDSVKNGGIVWMLPNVEGATALGERRPNYLWVPLGSFAFAARLAREGLGLADPVTGLETPTPKPGREVNSVGDAAMRAMEVGGEILAMFSPVKGENLGSSVASLIPPVASEAIEVGVTNKDLYRGNTIATDRRDENASRLSQGVAAGLNYLGNTDQVRPSQVEHVVRGVGGYAGQLATAASDLGRDRGDVRPIQDIPVLGGLASRVVRDTGGQRLEDVSSTAARAPESVRGVLAEAGLRSDQVTDVASRYKGAELTRGEQEIWQAMTNSLLERELATLQRSSEWRERGADKEKLVRAAIASAKQQAAERALRRLDDREIERRKQAAERRAS